MKYMHFMLPTSGQYQGFTMILNGKRIPIERHTDCSIDAARQQNRAIAFMSEEMVSQVNYFVRLREEDIPQNRISRIQITSEDDKFNLPILHHYSVHIPEKHRYTYLQNHLRDIQLTENDILENKNKNQLMSLHPKLKLFQLDQSYHLLNNNISLPEFYTDLDLVLSPFDIAKSLVFHYPELANTQPSTAAIVMNNHIAPPENIDHEQYNRICELATVISAQGPDKWAYRTYSTNQKTNEPLTYEYDVLGHKAGDKVEIYDLSQKTLDATSSPLSAALKTANQDSKLQHQTWQVSQGKTANKVDEETSARLKSNKSYYYNSAETNGIKWTVKEETPSHGLSVFEDSLSYDKEEFSIEVKNYFLRTLSAYVQFLDDAGKPIDNTKKFLSIVGPVDTVMGIPTPIWKKKIEFDFNKDASSAKLLFGGIGTSRIDTDVDLTGGILTGIFQYGIPTFFLVADAAMTSNKFFTDCLEDAELVEEIIKTFLEIAQISSHSSEATEFIYEFIELMAKTIGGILVKKVMTKILAYIIAEITAQEVADSIPFAGWILRIANVVIDVAQIVETTAEVLSSPATLSIVISRSMNLSVTVHPDPKHGELNNPSSAVWPAVGDNWQTTLTYKGGTSQIKTGKLSETTSNTPIVAEFENVPVGGKLKITTCVYSKDGWLCGKWESDWQNAFPDSGSDEKTMDGSITEVLVPLTQDVQYNYKEKVIYDTNTNQYILTSKNKPTETKKDLNSGGLGNNLSQLINITYNSAYKQIGYTWSASGDNLPPIDGDKRISIEFMVQNLSVLSQDSLNSRYKTGEIGFAVQPYIGYDKFGAGSDNYILDTRNNQCHLRKVDLMDGKNTFGLTNDGLMSYGKFNQPILDAMVIHPNGFAIGVNWANNKMEILEIPATPSDDATAEVAQLVSGEGIRQGLLNGPMAIKIAPDGRVLVLESSNRRIQGFDTYGNPVPSFTGRNLLSVDADDYRDSLNAKQFSESLQQVFNNNNLTYLFSLNISDIDDLNSEILSQSIIDEFASNGVYLCYEKNNMEDHTVSSYVKLIECSDSWMVVDPGRNYSYSILKNGNQLQVFDVLNEVTVEVEELNKKWLIHDLKGAKSYLAFTDASGNTINFFEYLSYMSLYTKTGSFDTYLDFSVEAKGYIYVLSYQNAGEDESDYYLDIYNPDGSFLVRTPDDRLQPENPQYLNVAKFEVDEFRNIHTLNFEKMTGKFGKTEPTISNWIPTPPIFDLGINYLSDFQQGNMDLIRQDFNNKCVVLSSEAKLVTVTENAYYQVLDKETIDGVLREITYDVILCINTLEVYKIIGKQVS